MAGQVSKLAYVDNKLGAPSNGQQTTRVLYDSFSNTTGVQQTQIEFFTDFQGKTLGQTNLQVSKLDSAESMVIKSLWFAGTFEGVDPSPAFTQQGGVVCDVIVGNQTVVKSLPLHFNTFVGEPYDRIHKVVVRGANLGNGDTGTTICALSGYGQIFSAGTTF